MNTFLGQGWSDLRPASPPTVRSPKAGFYVDALAGYAYFNNQLQRQILIPGLQQRTATGSTGANQFLGQIEGGYKLGVYAPAAATITPFGRFQISSVTENAFSELGAQSLSLNVAQQTTNSQRTTIGADLGSSIGLGNERKLDLAVRLGCALFLDFKHAIPPPPPPPPRLSCLKCLGNRSAQSASSASGLFRRADKT